MLHRSATLLILFSLMTAGVFGQGIDNFSQNKTDWEEINFEFNSKTLVDGYPSLLRLAELLGKHPDFKVTVTGNADFIGSHRYNDKLALQRAEMVKSFLVKYGANGGQITTQSRGKRNPESQQRTKDGRFINRRVSLTVVDGKGNPVSDGSIGDAIAGMGDISKKCCDDILARLDKLDDILKKLDQFMGENAGLKRDLASLQDKVNKLEGDVGNVDAKVNKLPDENKVSNIVDTESMKQIRNSRDPRFAILGMNGGVDDSGHFTFTGKARYFAPVGKLFGENFAVQAQGEYLYFRDNREGQFDIGLVTRIGNAQLGSFGSFKHVTLRGDQNGATLGQYAGTFDYLFSRGKVGIFGTKGFMDGGVVNSVQISQNLIQQSYLGIVDQYGVSATVGAFGNTYLEGNVGWLRSKAGADRPGGTLRFVAPIRDRLAFTLQGDLNPTFLHGYQSTRVTAGIELGNFIRPKDYLGMTGPVPVDVPRVRYEVLTRTIRNGFSPPVAVVGPDQIGVPAGTITLNGCSSYSPDNFPLTFEWRQSSGPSVSISGMNTCTATFTAVAGQAYGFILVVKDDHGGQDSARTTVTTSNPVGPQIVRFAANPPLIKAGDSSVISWQVLNADTVEIQPNVGLVNPQAGTVTVSPTVTTNYRIVARNKVSEVSDTLTITVQGAAPIITSFTANPASITSGQSSTLTWATQNATTVTISTLGTVAASGSAQVSPTVTTTYVLTASNATSSVTSTATVTVTGGGGGGPVGLPIVTSFTANPTTINSGQCSTLSWQVTNAQTVTITTLNNVALTGSSSVCPTTTTTYTLTATNANGSTTANVTVTVNTPVTPPVNQPPTITATASPNPSPASGTPVTITYSTTNANRVIVIGVTSSSLPANGTVKVAPFVTTTYTLVAYNDTTNQTATTSVTVTVNAGGTGTGGPAPRVVIQGAPIIVTVIRDVVLDASASTDPNGGPLTYRWTSLDNHSSILDPTSPRPRVQVEALYGDYLFQVTVTNSRGVSATGVVTVRLNVTRSP